MTYILIFIVFAIYLFFAEKIRRQRIVSAISTLRKEGLEDHISDIWSLIINSPPLTEYPPGNELDFRGKAIKKWRELNSELMSLDFGYFGNPTAFRNLTNDLIKPSEEQRQAMIKAWIHAVDKVLDDPDLQKHRVLRSEAKNLGHYIEHLNIDLRKDEEWARTFKKWSSL